MSRFSDALKFESWRGKQFWDAIRDDPQRLFTGAFDPIGTKIYNEVSGDNLEPLGNQLGAPTEDQYAKAEARGMNTSGARSMNDAAQVIAAIYGGQALAGAAGVGGSAGAGAGSSAGGMSSAMRMGSALSSVGGSNAQMPTSNPPPMRGQGPPKFQDTFSETQRKFRESFTESQRKRRLAAALRRQR